MGLATAQPSPLHRRLVFGLAGLLLLTTLALWQHATEPGPEMPGFVSAYQMTVAVCDCLTALMLLSQFVQFRTADLLILTCGYCFTAVIVTIQLASFPGVFAPNGIIGGNASTAPWLWATWHSVFPLTVLVYAVVHRSIEIGPWRAVAGAVLLTGGFVAGATLFATRYNDLLPPMITGLSFSPFFLGFVYPVMIGLCIAALIALLYLPSRYPAISLYLILAVVGILLDVVGNWHSGARYAVGWYLGRMDSFISSVSLCLVLIIDNAVLLRYANAAAAELRIAKNKADQANDAKSRFLAAISHDLRQPLAALSLYVGSLGHKLPSADSAMLANMRDSVSHLSEMLSNLLDLSRLEANVIKPKVGDFDLDGMLRKVASTFGPEARAKRLALRVGYFGKIGRTDPVLYQRMVSNLVSNAIRYTKHGGVLIGTRRRHGKAWVEVWDTGIGIPCERTAEVFEEFKQLGNSERNVAKGSGLGLAIVAQTAELLGLEVRVRSKLNVGSMFAIELPVGTEHCHAAPPRFQCEGLLIGLVEDNAMVAAALSHSLAEVGHRVVSAKSADELLLHLGEKTPDLVISDYRLSDEENGLDVIARTRSVFGSSLPAIMITGDTAPGVIGHISAQAVRVLHKPVELDALRTTVAEAVTQPNTPAVLADTD